MTKVLRLKLHRPISLVFEMRSAYPVLAFLANALPRCQSVTGADLRRCGMDSKKTIREVFNFTFQKLEEMFAVLSYRVARKNIF